MNGRRVLLVMAVAWWAVGGLRAAVGGTSGTLPVVCIQTADGRDPDSRTDYVAATCYIDVAGLPGRSPLGSSTSPVGLQIRGRGNYTWYSFSKKPYRLKFDTKQAPLSMAANRHFALLAHADDDVGFMRNAVGFEVGRLLHMAWTPAQQPVELVLNGRYAGLYFLTETVRPGSKRVDIDEQADGETDPAKVASGGWLVEIDNNSDRPQLVYDVTRLPLDFFKVTWHSPEQLSDVQYAYLQQQFQDLLDAICDPDKTTARWAQMVDVDALVRYYIAQEVTDHLEGFLGSCFLYKQGADGRWTFGPLWDLGHAFNSGHSKQLFTHEGTWFPPSIANELVKFPFFQQRVRQLWPTFYPDGYNRLFPFIDGYATLIAAAARSDYALWPDYGNADVEEKARVVKQRLVEKVAFLNAQWGTATTVGALSTGGDGQAVVTTAYDLSGRRCTAPRRRGLYVVRQADGTARLRLLRTAGSSAAEP